MRQSPQRMDIEGGSISEKARQWLSSFQEWKCAICGASKKLNPDYDTKSGELRGLICKECNLNIGRIERRGSVSIKDPNYNQIKDYLNNYPAKRAKLMRIVPLKKFIIGKNLEKQRWESMFCHCRNIWSQMSISICFRKCFIVRTRSNDYFFKFLFFDLCSQI